jgi:Tfp pilus assembly protein PilN
VTQPLELNLATHPFRNNTLLWAAHGVACASLLAFSIWNVNAFLDESGSLKELRGQVAQVGQRMTALDLRDQRAQAGIARHDLKDLSVQAGTANEVILMKALSWTRLFNLLEKVVPYEVKTVAVRPAFGSVPRGGPEAAVAEEAVPVSIQGIAQSIEAFLELERSLIMDTHFDQVEPEKTDVVAGGEVAFQVRFLYFPDGRSTSRSVPDLPHVLEAAAAEAASPGDIPEGSDSAAASPATAAPAPVPAAPVLKPATPPAGRPAARVEKKGKR